MLVVEDFWIRLDFFVDGNLVCMMVYVKLFILFKLDIFGCVLRIWLINVVLLCGNFKIKMGLVWFKFCCVFCFYLVLNVDLIFCIVLMFIWML